MPNKIDWNDESIREVFFDLSANYGALRAAILLKSSSGQEDLLSRFQDKLGGNSGIAIELAEMAEEFEIWWKSLPEDDPHLESYYEAVDDFFNDKLARRIADRLFGPRSGHEGLNSNRVEKAMKDEIVEQLAKSGWHKERIVDAFSKTFETVVAPKNASIWLRFSQEDNCWRFYGGDFTSAGENVLAVLPFDLCSFPLGMAPDEIGQRIGALVAEMERRIAGAYSVHLLEQPNTENAQQECTGNVPSLKG